MSNSLARTSYTELKRTTIDDIYGNGWWERNRKEVNRSFDWEFRYATKGERILPRNKPNVNLTEPVTWSRSSNPLIVILAEKPQPPTLRDIYGVDEVTIPTGWEWTGEWKIPTKGDNFLSGGDGTYSDTVHTCPQAIWSGNRLILRKRAPKVWFKAEEKARCPQVGEWFYAQKEWLQADVTYSNSTFICATRHEEPDLTTQTVTQADIDRLRTKNN